MRAASALLDKARTVLLSCSALGARTGGTALLLARRITGRSTRRCVGAYFDIRLFSCRVERLANKSQPHKRNELSRLADTLVDRVSRKSDVMKRNLEPGSP